MDKPNDSVLLRLLAPAAVALVAGAVLLRWCASTAASGPGFNGLSHTLLILGAAIWLAEAALRGSWTFRWSGAGVALLLFALLGFLSIHRASYKLPVLEHAWVFFSLAVLYFVLLNLFAKRRAALLTILLGFLSVVSVYAILQRTSILPALRESTLGRHERESAEFEARLLSNEVWGTFFYPNTLAGFLAMALPIAAGFVLDSRKGRMFGLIALAAGLVALLLTGSKGGWVAAGVGFLLFGGLVATRNRPKWRPILWSAVGAAGALVLVLVATGPLSPGRLRNESMRLRNIYWSSAVRIATDHPALGVGLDNYQEFYPAYRGDAQQEVRKAHNDYLQVLADLGIPGAVLFLAFLLGTLHLGARRPLELDSAESSPRERWLLSGAGAAAILLALLFVQVFAELGGAALLLVLGAWLLFTAFAHRGIVETATGGLERTRLGAVAGFAAILVHLGVDFAFYDYGAATAIVFVSALIAILSGRGKSIELSAAPAGLAAALLVGVLVPMLLVLPRLLEADRLKGQWPELLQLAGTAEAKAEALAAEGKKGEAGDKRAEAAAHYTEWLRNVETCERLNFLDSDAYLQHARLCEILWDRTRADRDFGDGGLTRMAVYEDTALQAIRNALHVRPRSAAARVGAGLFHRKLARYYDEAATARGERGSLFRQQALHHRLQAGENLLEAVKLYPGRAQGRYFLARAIDEGFPGSDAATHYSEAIRLSDLAGRESLERLQLTSFQKSLALIRLRREDEARALLAETLRAGLFRSNPKPEQQRLAIEDLLGTDKKGEKLRARIGDEYEGRLKEIADAILLGILDDLKRRGP